MKIKGRGISPGTAEGEVALCNKFVSPLGEMGKDGRIKSGTCEGLEFKNKIFVFKGGRGSTVGSYVLLELKENGVSPSGIINEKSEIVILTGAIISQIPMVDSIPIDIFEQGDRIRIDGKTGEVEIPEVVQKDTVTVYLFNGEKLLLLKRSDKVNSYQGKYSAVSGHIEKGESPSEAGIREIREETGITDVKIKTEGKPFPVRWKNIVFNVHPIIAITSSSDVKLNWENSEFRWINPEEIGNFQTVPKLGEALIQIMKEHQ